MPCDEHCFPNDMNSALSICILILQKQLGINWSEMYAYCKVSIVYAVPKVHSLRADFYMSSCPTRLSAYVRVDRCRGIVGLYFQVNWNEHPFWSFWLEWSEYFWSQEEYLRYCSFILRHPFPLNETNHLLWLFVARSGLPTVCGTPSSSPWNTSLWIDTLHDDALVSSENAFWERRLKDALVSSENAIWNMLLFRLRMPFERCFSFKYKGPWRYAVVYF